MPVKKPKSESGEGLESTIHNYERGEAASQASRYVGKNYMGRVGEEGLKLQQKRMHDKALTEGAFKTEEDQSAAAKKKRQTAFEAKYKSRRA